MKRYLYPFLGLLGFALIFAGLPLANQLVGVANTTVLQSYPSAAAYVGVVMRVTDGVAGAPPMYFKASALTANTSPCTLNAGAGDGASQVPTADGNCWLGIFPDGYDIRQFGGKNDGSADDTAAWNAMILSNPSYIKFAPGTYKFNSAISYTVPNTAYFNLLVSGPQQDVATLLWPNAAGGMTLTLQALTQANHVQNLAFVTQQAGGGNALELTTNLASVTVPNWAQSTVSNVTFAGSDSVQSGGTKYWTKGLYSLNVGTLSCDTCTFLGSQSGAVGGYAGNGIGWDIEGDGSHLATLFNAYNTNGEYLAKCWNYGNNVQGLTIQFSNCTGGTTGLAMSGGSGQIQDSVEHTQFNVSGTAISLANSLSSPDLHDNLIFLPNNSAIGIDLEPACFAAVHHNTIEGLSTVEGTGIKIGSTCTGTNLIDHNILESLTTGVSVVNGSTFATLRGNTYYGDTTNVSNGNTSYHRSLVFDTPMSCATGMTVQFGGAAVGMTQGTPYCSYDTTGNLMTIDIAIALSAKGSSTGSATLVGLPLDGTNANIGACQMVNYSGMSSLTTPMPYIAPGTATVVLAETASTGAANTTDANFTNSSAFDLVCTVPQSP